MQNPKEMYALWSIPFRQCFVSVSHLGLHPGSAHRPDLGRGEKCNAFLRFLGVPDSTPLQTSPLSSLEKKQSLILKGGWRRIPRPLLSPPPGRLAQYSPAQRQKRASTNTALGWPAQNLALALTTAALTLGCAAAPGRAGPMLQLPNPPRVSEVIHPPPPVSGGWKTVGGLGIGVEYRQAIGF